MVWNLLRSKNLFVCNCFLHSCSVYQSVLGSVTLCNYRHNSKDVTICMYGCTFLGFQTDGIVDWLVANNCIRRNVNEADWLRHENFYPVIIEKADWKQVQALLKQQARPAVNNRTKHRYAGLLTCRECGNAFIPMIRCWNGKSRVEYVCRGYHRNGKTYCASHRIHEEVLDAAVQEYAETVRKQCAEELKKLVQMQKMWALRKPILDAHILSLQEKVQVLEQEIDEIVMEKIIHQT